MIKKFKMITKAITYEELLTSFRKGLRNGNWRKLNRLDKALYRASLWYTKHLGGIFNGTLVKKLLGLVERMEETKGMRIFKRGLKNAAKLLEEGEETGVFVWVPRLRHWLNDPDYIFWLGTVR